jgi:hypothetical protein
MEWQTSGSAVDRLIRGPISALLVRHHTTQGKSVNKKMRHSEPYSTQESTKTPTQLKPSPAWAAGLLPAMLSRPEHSPPK